MTKPKRFQPILASRAGEGNAWILTFLVFIIWLFMRLSGQKLSWSVTAFLAFFALVACLISLGNWVERHTLIMMDADGISFENGLREVRLNWGEIEHVWVKPSVWGKRVRVQGKGKQFDFHTLGEVKYKGTVKAHTGFAEGDEMIRRIVLNSGLGIAEDLGDSYSYTRKDGGHLE
ncbi:MAG: hypothetical protein ACPL6F_03525 [Anaerolineales bacterium]